MRDQKIRTPDFYRVNLPAFGFKRLITPWGLPKHTEVVQDSKVCGLGCGLEMPAELYLFRVEAKRRGKKSMEI